MKFSVEYDTYRLFDRYIIVPKNKDLFNQKALLIVNELGYFIINTLKDDLSREELIKIILLNYDADLGLIEEDVNKFLDKLNKRSLIQE